MTPYGKPLTEAEIRLALESNDEDVDWGAISNDSDGAASEVDEVEVNSDIEVEQILTDNDEIVESIPDACFGFHRKGWYRMEILPICSEKMSEA